MRQLKIYLFFLGIHYFSIIFAQNVRNIEVSMFTKIEILGNFDVELRKSSTHGVKMNGSDEQLANVKIVVKLGTLRISNLKNAYNKTPETQIIVNYTQLEKIVVSANASILTQQVHNFDSVHLVVSSGGKGNLQFDVNKINVVVDKGGSVSIEGKAKFADIEAASGGVFEGYNFTCDSAVVRANTGGLAKVHVKNYLSANALAGGEISYRGKPKHFVRNKTIGGKISSVKE